MELSRALKLIMDNRDVDPEMFNRAVHTTLHDTAMEIRGRLEKLNLNATEHGGQWLHLGEVYTGPMEKTRDNATFQWSSGFTIGNHQEIDIMVTVLNFGAYAHEPSITVKLVGADKKILYMKSVWFKDDGCSLIHDMVKEALESLPKPEPLKMGEVCKADEPPKVDEPPKMEWFYMTFWNDHTLLDIVRSEDYDEIATKWHRDSSKKLCTPIMNGLWPSMDVEAKMLDKLSGEVSKDNDFMTLAAEFDNWAKRVEIGNQVWTADNLRLDDGGEGIYADPNTGETYYTWEAAVRVTGKIPGWHLPTRENWEELAKFVSGKTGSDGVGYWLKSTVGWSNCGNGSDLFGFKAKPTGYYSPSGSREGSVGYFWSATPRGISAAYCRSLQCTNSYFDEGYNCRSCGLSVRLLKDSAQQEGK